MGSMISYLFIIVVFPMEKYTFWSVHAFVIFDQFSLLLHVLANIPQTGEARTMGS